MQPWVCVCVWQPIDISWLREDACNLIKHTISCDRARCEHRQPIVPYTRDTFYLLRKLAIKIKRKIKKYVYCMCKIASQVIIMCACAHYNTRIQRRHANIRSYNTSELLCRHCHLILFANLRQVIHLCMRAFWAHFDLVQCFNFIKCQTENMGISLGIDLQSALIHII